RFDTKDAKVHRITLSRNHSIFANDAVLLAASHDFSCQQDQRTLGIVYQNESVYLGYRTHRNAPLGSTNQTTNATGLGNNHRSRADTLIQGNEAAGVVCGRCYDREDRQLSVGDRTEDLVSCRRVATPR